MEAFFRGLHATNFFTCGFSRSYNQAAEVPSSNVTCKSPRSPSINSRIMLAFVSITHSITIFPAPFLTAIEMLSLCTSMPIYFLLSIQGVPFCRGFEPNTQNPTPKADCYETRVIKRFRAMFRVPEHRFFVWGGEFTLSSRDDWVERDQVACRAACSLRPPRMFIMRFRL